MLIKHLNVPLWVTANRWSSFSNGKHCVKCLCARTSNSIYSHQRRWQSTDPAKYGPKKKTVDLSRFPVDKIRNFSIIAHIDHGKSTLSDRLLQVTGLVSETDLVEQYLDKLQVERERGITVKAQSCSLIYNYKGEDYLLNLIDTPGHVDFQYEVCRSLAACQGVVLLIDANSGIQAQTVAHFNHALLSGLTMIPALNKIDLKNARPEEVIGQINSLFAINEDEVLKVSAKTGVGVDALLNAIVERIPPPTSARLDAPFRALLFDSWYEKFKGAIALIYVLDGSLKKGEFITCLSSGKSFEVKDVGIMHPEMLSTNSLHAGQVGYIIAIREVRNAAIGDVLVRGERLSEEEIQKMRQTMTDGAPKIEKAKPMVFAGLFPCEQSKHPELRDALERLVLNDASVELIPESSPALGHGWTLGFLGLLHMEVFTQRLDQEFDAQVVITTPSVPYRVKIHGEKNIKHYHTDTFIVTNPLRMPPQNIIIEYQEPMVKTTIITPDEYMHAINMLAMERRGTQLSSTYIDNSRLMIVHRFPLNEVIVDFHDKLKNITSGYASFDYEDDGYQKSDLVLLDFYLNDKRVEELSFMVHASRAKDLGRQLCDKLREELPQQQYKIKIQAKVNSKVVGRADLAAMRKDVLAKIKSGSDQTRKAKLLQRQAEGKAKLRMVGNVQVPREAFINILKR